MISKLCKIPTLHLRELLGVDNFGNEITCGGVFSLVRNEVTDLDLHKVFSCSSLIGKAPVENDARLRSQVF